jgi:hypothetical protein
VPDLKRDVERIVTGSDGSAGTPQIIIKHFTGSDRNSTQ